MPERRPKVRYRLEVTFEVEEPLSSRELDRAREDMAGMFEGLGDGDDIAGRVVDVRVVTDSGR